ncbi:YigZ family protein [bacterium]|nr:YigZ family protein [bacterium]MBU1937133.1 YigZ family protein [bacterium]
MNNDKAPEESDEFRILAGPGTSEIRVLGSRFLGFALPVVTEQEISERLTEHAREFHDATHHCSAWILGAERREHSSDAGEPHGTAGIPILRAIQAARLTDALVIVTRYYGGTKLGKGNLARAYSTAASEALAVAPKKVIRRLGKFIVDVPFDDIGKLYTLANRCNWEIIPRDSAEGGQFELRVPIDEKENVHQQVNDATAGRAHCVEDGFWISR